jgi:hypothetical protein
MIDPLVDECLSLSQAARRLPRLRAGRPVAPSTLWRWATAGVRGVKLEVVRIGTTVCTSVPALQRFIAAINGRPASVTSNKRQERVERELTARWI